MVRKYGMATQSVDAPHSTPNPDPTVLTTEQMLREVSNVKDLLEAAIGGEIKGINTRLEAMDKAIILLQTTMDTFPTARKDIVAHLQELHTERFNSLQTSIISMRDILDQKFVAIDKQFTALDKLIEQASTKDSKALDAALATQKEAASKQNDSNNDSIRKSEDGFREQLKQLNELNRETTKSLTDKIDDMKGRLGALESYRVFLVGAIALLVALVGIALPVLSSWGDKDNGRKEIITVPSTTTTTTPAR